MSLLPEYVVPYMIHLLAHDPDFTKPQDYDQLKDIKESVLAVWFCYCDDLYKKTKIEMVCQTTRERVCTCMCRCLWFMLEVLMTKNENNSHAFLRKMVENIKLTKDAQCPDDAKANEVNTPFTCG